MQLEIYIFHKVEAPLQPNSKQALQNKLKPL